MSKLDMLDKSGNVIAKFVRYLEEGECGCKFDGKAGWFTDSNKVMVKL